VGRPVPVLTILRFAFSLIWILVFSYAVWEARNFPALSGLFPTVISLAGIVLALFTLVIDVRRWRREGGAVGADAPATASTAQLEPGASIGYAFARAGRYGLWLLSYLFLIWLIGLVPASAVFVALFLLVEARVRVRYLVVGSGVTVAGLLTLANAVNLFWPRSLITLID
jgi:hypothetical protein